MKKEAPTATPSNLEFIEAPPSENEVSFAEAVDRGLSQPQKSLPPRFFYDRRGSELFERITQLPEYYLTGCEASILESCSGEIVGLAGGQIAFVEFGSGSSQKTRLLIEAALKRQPRLRYVTIDISAEFLRQSAESLVERYPGLGVTAIAGEYFAGVEVLPEEVGRRMFLFMGSNVGNFEDHEAVAFLSAVREAMRPDDWILLGIDLAKDRSIVEPAYNDPQGVTAEFNLNILRRINRELGGRFDLSKFRHEALYLESSERVEMRLVSLTDQVVEIAALGNSFHFNPGEYIHTESSRKYSEASLRRILTAAELDIDECWKDPRKWFSILALRRQAGVLG